MNGDQTSEDVLLGYAGQVLGPCELTEDCSWEHRMSRVLRLRDATGAIWFLKRHGERERYLAEVTAYRQWIPALGDRAPQLRAFDDSLQAMIVTAVPGDPAPWPAPVMAAQPGPAQRAEVAVQHHAGALLRRLHQAQAALPWNGFGPAKLDEFDQLSPLAAGLLTVCELAAARAEVAALTAVAGPVKVPCHRDYTPRNWLVGAGSVCIIDFEWSRLDVWVSDLARLHLGIWESRLDLRDAFLGGYGRDLDDTDLVILQGCSVLTAVWLVIKARETGQPSFEDASRAALQRLIP